MAVGAVAVGAGLLLVHSNCVAVGAGLLLVHSNFKERLLRNLRGVELIYGGSKSVLFFEVGPCEKNL